MPFVDPTFVDYLFERAASHEAAVPRPDEWFQTTQAVYHADAMHDACQRALERGEHKIVEPLFVLAVVSGATAGGRQELSACQSPRRSSRPRPNGSNERGRCRLTSDDCHQRVVAPHLSKDDTRHVGLVVNRLGNGPRACSSPASSTILSSGTAVALAGKSFSPPCSWARTAATSAVESRHRERAR